MIGVRAALDTSIAIAILNRVPSAPARFDAEGPFAVPAVVAGELLFGAANSGLGSANLRRFEAFLANAILLEVNLETARRYSALRLELKTAGRPIPENDLWIAAACLQHSLTFVSN